MARAKRPVTIAGIEFDALISEEHGYEATVPEYAVESGFSVSDAIIHGAETLNMVLYVTDTPVTWRSHSGRGRVEQVTKQLEELYYAAEPVTIVTSDATYTSMAIENLTATTLRNIIGDLELDSTLTSRETINTKMRATLDEATDPWGIKVNRVELKNIIPPTEIQNAMEKQMKAERERREAILRAEGEKKSSILRAEGHKESMILEAEAEKEAAILNAEAKKEATIREAEGQAEAILKVQRATADGLRAIREAGADEAVIKLKSLEAFEKAADGKATKIIIPSEIQNLAGLVTSIKEVAAQPEAVEEVDTTEK